MKKKMTTLFVGICTAALLTGCGGGAISNDQIAISKYKGLEVEKVETMEVTDEQVEQSIQSVLESKSTENEITDRPVKEGDIATINYEGKKDGVAFEGGTSDNYPLTIGSGQFIEGFEEGIIGHSVGETFDLNLKFPEEYPSEDLAGQDVVFTVTVNKISEKVLPELTDTLVAEVSKKSKTVDEFKSEVKKDLQKSNEESAKSRLEQSVWEELVKNSKVEKYPEEEKKVQMEAINAQYSSVAQMYGMQDVNEFTKQMFGVDVEEMAEKTLSQQYAIDLIAEKEKIEISDKEYKEGIKKYAKQFGYADEAELEEVVGKNQLKKSLIQDKVADILIKNCKQVEKKADTKKK